MSRLAPKAPKPPRIQYEFDPEFVIGDSAKDAEFQDLVARKFLAASDQREKTVERILKGVLPSPAGMDPDLIRSALTAFNAQLNDFANSIWGEAAYVPPTTEDMVEHSVQMILSFLTAAMRDLLGRVFDSFEPKQSWDTQKIRQTRRHLENMHGPNFERAGILIAEISSRQHEIDSTTHTERQKAWLRTYGGINSKSAWSEFRIKFPGTKKTVFEALFREIKGVRSRGRPKTKSQ